MQQLIQDLRSGSVEVVEVPDPSPADGEALVRNSWSLVSPGTEQAISETAAKSLVGKARERPDQARKVVDKALRDGPGPALAAVRARLDDLLTPGYSSAGVVERGVAGLTAGQRVACVGANVACHAERVAVPAPLCIPLPDGLDERWGAFAALGAIAGHGVRLGGVDAGAAVAVIGMGLVGQLAAQLATAAGARAVAIDPAADRVELARELGAAGGAPPAAGEARAAVDAVSGGAGADVVLIAAATADSAPVELACELARDRASVCVIGDVGMSVPRRPFYEKELQLRISRSYGPGRYDREYEQEGRDYPIGYVRWTERRLIAYFLDEVAAGRVRLDELVSHEFPIERAAEAYEAFSDPGRMGILLRYPDAPSPPLARRELRVAPRERGGRLRVGLLGPGLFARSTLIPALEKLDVELAAIAGSSPARSYGVGRRAGAAYVAASPDELLADDSIDVVVVATRHDSHAELAARALEAGKAVFLEKPLAIDEHGLARLKPLLEAGGRLVVDFNRDFAPATVAAARHFAGRADPLQIVCRVNAGAIPADHWLRDPERGGGRLIGEGCHFVELCARLVERPLETVQVAALGAGPVTLATDSFVVTLRYADGSLATVSYAAAGHAGLRKERVELFGAGRAAVIDDFRDARLHPGPRVRRPGLTTDKGHDALLAAAMQFFASGGEPPIPYARIVETTSATLVAAAALSEGMSAPLAVPGW